MNKQQARFMIFAILIILTVACNPGLDDAPLETAANFAVSSQEGEAPLMVHFIRRTVQTPYWLWDFGDGTQFSSTDSTSDMDIFRFSHEYEEPGTYEVLFMVRDESGERSTARKTIEVHMRAKIRSNSIIINRYRGLSSRYFDDNTNDRLKRIRYNTEIGDENFTCGIIGFKVQGQIGEASGGSIHADLAMMDLYMEAVDGDWFINAVFESEYRGESREHQLWDIDVLCVGNSAFERGGAKYIAFYTDGGAGYRNDLFYNAKLDRYVADIGVMRSSHFICGVVGFAFQDALYTPSPPYTLEARITIIEPDDNLYVWADFRDQSLPPSTKWMRMNVLCLTRRSYEPNIFLKYERLPHFTTGLYSKTIGVTGEDYACGVADFWVRGGKLDTSGDHQTMMMAQTQMISGNIWSVSAKIASDSNHLETWDINLICIDREYIFWDILLDCSSGSCILDEQ